MFQTIFAGLLIAIIVLPVPLLLLADKRQKRKALERMLHEFKSIGSTNGLSFSSQEVLRHTILGLDGMQRKLLVVKREADDTYQSAIIDINTLKSCLVDRQHTTIGRGDLAKSEPLLKTVSLIFHAPPAPPLDVVFYQDDADSISSVRELERKANQWQVMLTKLRMAMLETAPVVNNPSLKAEKQKHEEHG